MRVSKDKRRMYGDLAWAWPIFTPKEQYVNEAAEFLQLIKKNSLIPVKSLLHLGCGGGHLDFTLKKYCNVTSVDISEKMLDLARRLNPEVSYVPGDMRVVRLGATFDAVLVGDSIGYMLTEADLRAAFRTAREHVKRGGVFCTCAEVTRETFEQNGSKCLTGEKEGTHIAFFENQYDPDPSDTTYESTFVFVIRRLGKLRIETDRHLLGIFPLAAWQRLLRQAGFKVTTSTSSQMTPLFICIRPCWNRPPSKSAVRAL